MPIALANFGAFLWLHYSKDWVDVGTFVIAALFAGWKWVRSRCRMPLRAVGRRAMDGSCLFPLTLLTLSVLSRHMLEALLSASRVTLSIAGFFALVSILDEEKPG